MKYLNVSLIKLAGFLTFVSANFLWWDYKLKKSKATFKL